MKSGSIPHLLLRASKCSQRYTFWHRDGIGLKLLIVVCFMFRPNETPNGHRCERQEQRYEYGLIHDKLINMLARQPALMTYGMSPAFLSFFASIQLKLRKKKREKKRKRNDPAKQSLMTKKKKKRKSKRKRKILRWKAPLASVYTQ